MGQSELETAYLDQVAELFREMVDATTPYIQVMIGFRKDLNPVSKRLTIFLNFNNFSE
jgi:hypothetical protein